MDLEIRQMTENDLDQVLAIERESFPTPWSRHIFLSELRKDSTCYLVACRQKKKEIIGYGGLWFVFARDAHITNLAVAPEFRRHGVGQRLLSELISEAQTRDAELMTLEVRQKNSSARRLYRKVGFMPCGLRKNYYQDTGEDAVIMWLVIAERKRERDYAKKR